MSKTLLNLKVTHCNNFFTQGRGLSFRFPMKNFAFVFTFKKSIARAITMWFVFFKIDIVFLDSNNQVIELVSNLRPFTNYFPKKPFISFIEFPCGTIKSTSIVVGSKVSWSSKGILIEN